MLEDALEHYPATRQLDGGLECVVRPLEVKDESPFLAFLRAVPEIERMFIKQRLGSARFRKEWFRDLDYDKALPLVAVAHGHIIGSATLQQRLGGWKRHIGRVHSLTHPEYRDVGVSHMLIREMIEIALHCGLTRLETEFNGERQAAIQCFKVAGFTEMLRIPNYLKDMKGGRHDWVLLGMKLRPSAEYAGAGD
jgi:ribosomal protein S18 acetylase RimI-like enzyme